MVVQEVVVEVDPVDMVLRELVCMVILIKPEKNVLVALHVLLDIFRNVFK
jgi:hypothetical protein